MKRIKIEDRNGYMLDKNGRVCIKFGNWKVGEHMVPDYVESVHYVDGPTEHDVEIHKEYHD